MTATDTLSKVAIFIFTLASYSQALITPFIFGQGNAYDSAGNIQSASTLFNSIPMTYYLTWALSGDLRMLIGFINLFALNDIGWLWTVLGSIIFWFIGIITLNILTLFNWASIPLNLGSFSIPSSQAIYTQWNYIAAILLALILCALGLMWDVPNVWAMVGSGGYY